MLKQLDSVDHRQIIFANAIAKEYFTGKE